MCDRSVQANPCGAMLSSTGLSAVNRQPHVCVTDTGVQAYGCPDTFNFNVRGSKTFDLRHH